ncbi:hypothetical protein MRY87_05775 [bacterium]|nr:hypothetical protein [bacterium]
MNPDQPPDNDDRSSSRRGPGDEEPSLPEIPSLRPGATFGPYQIQQFLGRGAFARVYLAQEERSGGRDIVLKIGEQSGGGLALPRLGWVASWRTPLAISPDEHPAEFFDLDTSEQRLSSVEATAGTICRILKAEAEKLQKPRLGAVFPECYGFQEIEGRPVLAMEYLPGKTLREMMRDGSTIDFRWFQRLVSRLEHLSFKKDLLAHGDLKPSNIIVTEGGLRILDPGVSFPEHETLVTTPTFNPLLHTDQRADIMAIGIILYEIVTGVLPFKRAHTPWSGALRPESAPDADALSWFLSHDPIETINSEVAPTLRSIIERCIHGTYPGYGDLREDMERVTSS